MQVALSLIALIAAGLFLRELRSSQRIDTGFETRGVLVMNFNLLREGYTPERGTIFYDQIVERAAGLPGVQGAAIAQSPPLAGGFSRSVFPEGADTTTTGRILVQVNTVGTGYFQTIGIPLVRGRDFTRGDTTQAPEGRRSSTRRWRSSSGRVRSRSASGSSSSATRTSRPSIGVARDSKYNGVAEDPQNFIYQPLAQNYTPQATLHVRTAGDAASLANAVRGAARELDPSLSVFNIRTLEEQVSNSLQPLTDERADAGGVRRARAAAGVDRAVRRGELLGGAADARDRRAHGARRAAVERASAWCSATGMILVGIGLAIGLVVGLFGRRADARRSCVGVSPHDPLTFAATAAGLGAVALLASYIPARRATRIDPLIALRTD